MEPYIFSSKNKIHIIDIRETVRGLIVARKFIRNLVAKGERLLVVGTKYQAREIVRRKASEHDIPYVVDRWLGGTLTNFQTIRSRLERLEEIEQWEEDGTLDLYSKKEQSKILREKEKLLRNLGGIRDLKELPGALVAIDPLQEKIAVSEANKKDIPIIGLIDTDGDPDKVDIPVPCNDEAMRVISMMMDQVIAAKKEGEKMRSRIPDQEAAEEVSEEEAEEKAEEILQEEREQQEEEAETAEETEETDLEETDAEEDDASTGDEDETDVDESEVEESETDEKKKVATEQAAGDEE